MMKRNIATLLVGLLFCIFAVSCCHGHGPRKINVGNQLQKQVHARDATVFIAIEATRLELEATVTGTGVTIMSSKSDDISIVLTAGHLCWVPMDPLVSESKIMVFERDGNFAYAEIKAVSTNFDLCLLEVSKPLPAAGISVKPPESGDKVYYSGYPTGFYVPNVISHFEGYMAGTDPSGDHLYNIPATGGASGSPVYNEKGQIIGIISAVMVDFDQMTFATGNENIIDFLRETGYLKK